MADLDIFAGPRAFQRLRDEGLQASQVGIIPAAAGGPKGLIFQALDQYLFGQWLPAAPRPRDLIGSSIGAWRMAAACHADPVAAFARLGEQYCGQRYTAKPSPQEIDAVVRRLLAQFIDGHEDEVLAHPRHRLYVIAVRGLRALAAPGHRRAELSGFARAALVNLVARRHLTRWMERVVIASDGALPAWMNDAFDPFTSHAVRLTQDNLHAALLASGTLPLIMQPVRAIAGAPDGSYWDGGLIDYNLALPYARSRDLVLYPHFHRHIAPGWLDKGLPWRRMARSPLRHWLDNMIVVAPSAAFLRRLPGGKLPDRKDFTAYGLDHDGRIRAWQQAIGEGQRLRDAFAGFVRQPDLGRVAPLCP
ncbi:MAG: patatin-like phospholipase family protein [Gammaproteobacteria bacterium]